MIIGNGLIAKEFGKYETNKEVLIFASGVSNSKNEDQGEFNREIELLTFILNKNQEKIFVYISSCSIDDETMKNSKYVKHKLKAENIIKKLSKKYIIFRTSNPIGNTNNPNTLLNFLYGKIISGENFSIWSKARRNFIDVQDLFKICDYIIENNIYINEIINIASPNYHSILEVVELLEKKAGKNANYETIPLGGTPLINIEKITKIIKILSINFDNNYLEKIINKYY